MQDPLHSLGGFVLSNISKNMLAELDIIEAEMRGGGKGGLKMGKRRTKPLNVRSYLHLLPDEKAGRELHIAEAFVDQLSRFYGRTLGRPEQLREADNDFRCSEGAENVIMELTELVGLSFAGQIPDGFSFYIDRQNDALANVIRAKLNKSYAKPSDSEFWLVVWSTYPYPTEYWFRRAGSGESDRVPCPAMVKAREVLEQAKSNPFDEVWFTDLGTIPARVQPPSRPLPQFV